MHCLHIEQWLGQWSATPQCDPSPLQATFLPLSVQSKKEQITHIYAHGVYLNKSFCYWFVHHKCYNWWKLFWVFTLFSQVWSNNRKSIKGFAWNVKLLKAIKSDQLVLCGQGLSAFTTPSIRCSGYLRTNESPRASSVLHCLNVCLLMNPASRSTAL